MRVVIAVAVLATLALLSAGRGTSSAAAQPMVSLGVTLGGVALAASAGESGVSLRFETR